MSPGLKVPSRFNNDTRRPAHHRTTTASAPSERIVAWIKGGMSGSVNLIATWFSPQLRHSATTSAAPTLSSGRAL